MALSDTLSELAGTGPATRNRVSSLLDQLHADSLEDYETLVQALRNPNVRAATLTKALRKEYGHDIVKDSSVAEFRRHNTNITVTGL